MLGKTSGASGQTRKVSGQAGDIRIAQILGHTSHERVLAGLVAVSCKCLAQVSWFLTRQIRIGGAFRADSGSAMTITTPFGLGDLLACFDIGRQRTTGIAAKDKYCYS